MATKHFLGGRIILGTEFEGYQYRIFEAGTATPKTTYKDSALTGGNENSDPIVLDSNGACQIWFDGNAKTIFYDPDSATIYSDDNVNLGASVSTSGDFNLILNNSFEDDGDGDGIPDNWTRTLYTDGAFSIDRTSGNQNNGAASVKFTSVGSGGGYITSTDTFSVSPSVTYSVGFSIKSSVADVRNFVQVLWYKYDGSASSTASTTLYDDSTTNPTSWTEKWYQAASPSDARYAKIQLIGCHSSDATTGSTWFDAIYFSDSAIKRAINEFSNIIVGKLPLATNARISPSVGSSALTIALKGNDGNDPSVSNPVYIPFRNSTIGTGGLTWLSVTAATSLVVSSGSTLGTSSGVAHRLWVVGINDGGTFRLGVLNAKLSGGGIFYLSNDLLVSSTAEGGAGGADSAGVIYTGTAVSSKAIRILGYIESTQATAGTWATTPSKAQEWDNGMSLPGSIVQQQFVSSSAFSSLGTTATPSDNTIPLLTEGNSVAALDLSITPTSAINMLMIESHIHLRTGDPAETTIHLHQDSTSNALAAYAWNGSTNIANVATKSQVYRMAAGTASSTTFKWRAGSHTGSTIAVNSLTGGVGGAYNGTAYSWAQITELMV